MSISNSKQTRNIYAFDSGENNSQKPNLISLAEVVHKGDTWDKHRQNAEKVAEHYAKAEDNFFNEYAIRIQTCAEWLEFGLIPEETTGNLNLKLVNARFCRVRHCPICQWRRSLMWKAKAYKIIPQVITDYPKYRWLFITLTVRNCQITELRESLNEINKGFKRLTELKIWPAKGWVKSLEVTKGKDGFSAHPHLHILAMVQPSYFSHGYISQAKWVELWKQSLKISYEPVLYVKAVAKKHDPKLLIPEILKYQVKESDLIDDKEWFLELTRQLHKTRAIAVGGILRQYMRELEEDNQNLIDEDTVMNDANINKLSFRWDYRLQKYKIKSDNLDDGQVLEVGTPGNYKNYKM